jgi:TfoX/Sxy family transcriptional regulator of competence genes
VAVAYDVELAEHIRLQLAGRADVTEKRMFGGIGFMVGGHLAIAASSQGGALVRVDPDASDQLLARTKAEVAVMRGRPMTGWLRVASADLHTSRQLRTWLDRSLAYVESLPDKPPRRR